MSNNLMHDIETVKSAGKSFDTLIVQVPRIASLPDGKSMGVQGVLINKADMKQPNNIQGLDQVSRSFSYAGDKYPKNDDYAAVVAIVAKEMGVKIKVAV